MATTTLLRTKLYFPALRPTYVARPRLVARLQEGLRHPLTLVSAPAGYGKTTLLSEWRAGAGATFPIAWLSLDAGDDDPARFFDYLVAALGTLGDDLFPDTVRLLRAPTTLHPEAVLTCLINELGALPGDFALVLDDYHLITSAAIHDGVTFLLDHLPAAMRLVILTRADPPLPLARLRARFQLVELRAADLRFTRAESVRFINDVMGLNLSVADVAAMEKRTEGWVAGLQLAALALQGIGGGGGPDATAFVAGFSGSHRYIVDYLGAELLNRQPAAVQTFLLQTAILDRLNADLCDAVTQIPDAALPTTTGALPASPSQQILDHLERSNLFVVPLDDTRRWYRYHHLFADLLRHWLQQSQPTLVPELHRRASQWYAARGETSAALSHAFAGEHTEMAADLLEDNSNDMLDDGGWGPWLAWLAQLPDRSFATRPALALRYAWGLLLTSHPEGVAALLAHVTRAAADEPAWRPQVAAVRARVAYLHGDFREAIASASEALASLPEDDVSTHTLTLLTLGYSHVAAGNLPAGSEALEEARQADATYGGALFSVEAAGTLAQVAEAQGRLQHAAAAYRDILDLVGQGPSPSVLYAHLRLGNIRYEQYDLDRAQHHLQAARTIGQQIGLPDGFIFALLWLARVRLAQGAVEEAAALRQEARAQSATLSVDVLSRYISAWVARLALALGAKEEALRWADTYSLPPAQELPANFIVRGSEYLTLARTYLAANRTAAAETLLEQLRTVIHATALEGYAVETLALLTLCRAQQGDQTAALNTLRQALARAAPEGYVAPFVELGAPMAALLRACATRGIVPRYAAHVLTYMDTGSIADAPWQQPLVEPLSERELEVLALLALGRTNREIANELVLAIGTVKKHVSNICGKLNAGNRTECVARGRELGLL